MRLLHKNNHLPGLISGLIFLSVLSFSQSPVVIKNYTTVTVGAQQFESYLPLLKNKRVGVITNITGMIGKTTLVDTLIKLKVNVQTIFGPEHGFRSDADAGETVKNNRDKKTGVKVISLYGSNKKPKSEQLKDLDILIYDIQDIGVRFYTYISTMCYAMEACAENGKELIILDRPNPNGFYIDGPVLREELKSFLGLHKVPLVYGMTCGEYATMANEEGWLRDSLKNVVKCKMTVVTLKNYDRNSSYKLPVMPSPNIPNEKAVLLYPSLGLFEGTVLSLGRGTKMPFQVIGHPLYPIKEFSFTPKPTTLSKDPKYSNVRCYGLDLREENYLVIHPKKINLSWMISMLTHLRKDDFFDKNFDYHAGNRELQQQLKSRMSENEIRESWQPDLDQFKEMRQKYLLYPDFE